jgi:hypothetical protein
MANFDLSGMDLQFLKNEIIRKIELITSTQEFEPGPSKLFGYCIFKTFCPTKVEVNKILNKNIPEEDPGDLPF